MNSIMARRLALLAVSVSFLCTALYAGESISQKAGALIAKQDILQLAQIYEQTLRPGAEAERAELSRTIIEHAKREDVPPVIKGELLTLLGRFGGAETVDFFAPLLGHEDPLLRTRALLALQHHASPQAAAALRNALAGAREPQKRAALIHALSLRQDRASLPQFIQDAAGADDSVRTAALLAVARTSDESANALFRAGMKQGSAVAKREATSAYLLHADRLAGIGKKREALEIYHELLGEDRSVKAAALLGMARAGGTEEVAPILENMKGAHHSVIDVAGRLFEYIPKSPPVIAAVSQAVKSADPAMKVRLLHVMGQYADPAGVDTVLQAAQDADPRVRIAAVSALGRFDDNRAADALVAALVAGKEPDAAVKAVGTSPRNSAIAEGLIAALPGVSGPTRVWLVRALATCPANKVVSVLLKMVEDADGAVRGEVFNALRRIGDPTAYPRLVDRLAEESDANAQATAVNALAAIAARIKDPGQRTVPVLARLAESGLKGRPALLRLLPRVSSEATQDAGLKFVREALSGQDEELRRAAIHAMAEWPDPDPVMDALLETAKKQPESALGVLALRAYGKQVGALAEKRGAAVREKRLSGEDAQKEIVRRCTEGLAAAAASSEKMALLSHLGRQPHPDALKAVAGCLDDPNVKREAIQAAMSIAVAIHRTHADAVKPVLEKIRTATDDQKLQSRVEQLLKAIEPKK